MVAPRAGFVTGPQEGEREEKVCRALSDPLGGFPVLGGGERRNLPFLLGA